MTVGSLALGMAVSTATFSLVNAMLFADQPGVADRHSLSRVFARVHTSRGPLSIMTSRSEYAALLAMAPPSMSLTAQSDDTELPVEIDGEAGIVRGSFVSANYFSGLGTMPAAGRLLGPVDDHLDADAIVIDTRLWRGRFGGAQDVIGRTITVGGRVRRIVGVAPRGFAGWTVQLELDEGEPAPRIWLPMATARTWAHLADDRRLFVDMAARLEKGLSREQAAAGMTPALANAGERYRQLNPDGSQPAVSVELRPITYGPGETPLERALGVLMLLLPPITVLAIGCANVANLRLAQASERARDLAVRLSLGGSRWRVMRPLAIEALALAALAAFAGTAGARLILDAVESVLLFAPIDLRVLAFVVALTFAVVLVSGLAPAWLVTGRLGGVHLRQSPQAGGLAHSRLRNALVVVQVALSLGLLTIGALSIRTLINREGLIDRSARELLVAAVDVRPIGGSTQSAAELARTLVEQLASDARIQSVAYGDGVLSDTAQQAGIRRRPATDDGINVRLVSMSGPWLDMLGQALLAGRQLGPADTATGAIIVNEAMARWIAPDGPVVGTVVDLRAYFGQPAGGRVVLRRSDEDASTRIWAPVEIVGVVADGPQRADRAEPERTVYRTFDLPASPAFTLIVRSSQTDAVARDLRTLVATLAGGLPWVEVETLDAIVRREMSPRRYLANIFGALGGMALALAATGLYAVIAYVVSLRSREIGIRVAVGANRVDVLRLVFRQALRIVAIGMAAGLVLTVPIAYAMRAVFVGISPFDPFSFGAITVLLGLVAILAAAAPARRAAGLDPVVALRAE
jgi:predicted permease